jgi:hypothetical protein
MKMGDLMAANGGRLLGLYDELYTFLIQLNLYEENGYHCPMGLYCSSHYTVDMPGHAHHR